MTTDSMVEVTRDEFFSYINPRDVNPSVHSPEFTDWETRNRQLVGRSYPGWKNPGDPKRWFLTATALASIKQEG